MKNNVIIRLENTLFDTVNVSKHIAKAKDRSLYLNTSLPKCKMNQEFVKLMDFVRKARSIGKTLNVSIITDFPRDVVWKLLNVNNMSFVQLFSSIERAINENDKTRTVVFTTDEKDKTVATINGDETCDPENESVFGAIGVKKAPAKCACQRSVVFL